jgi:hypothetical protein
MMLVQVWTKPWLMRKSGRLVASATSMLHSGRVQIRVDKDGRLPLYHVQAQK